MSPPCVNKVEASSTLYRRRVASPKREVEAFVGEIRSGGYEMLRSLAQAGDSLASLQLTLADVEISTMIVDKDCPIDGRALGDTELRRLYGITVVAIRRGDELVPNPGAEDLIHCGDALIVLGLADEIAAASALFQEAPEQSEPDLADLF